MSRILVVEPDSAVTELILPTLECLGHEALVVTDASSALTQLEDVPPDLILTAYRLPESDGLELVEEISRRFPRIPSVLMTDQGNEDLATEALLRGATSYIPKRRLSRDFQRTIQKLLGLSRAARRHRHLMACWRETSDRFVIDNSPELIPALVCHFQETLQLLEFADDRTRLRICVALTETLENAVYHGNLELSSALRSGDGTRWHEESERRRNLPPYSRRTVDVRSAISRDEVRFVIRDEGPGFDPAKLPDPRTPEHIADIGGRGVLLIRTFMDRVEYSSRGNEVTLVKLAPTNPVT